MCENKKKVKIIVYCGDCGGSPESCSCPEFLRCEEEVEE